jgi:hypothetical protein
VNVMPEGFDALDPLSQKLWLITDMEMNRLRDDMNTMADILIQITNAVCDLQEAGAAP